MSYLGPNSTPLLASRLHVRKEKDAWAIESEDSTILIKGDNLSRINKVFSLLDGATQIHKIAAQSEMNAKDLDAILSALVDNDLLLDTSGGIEARSQEDFIQYYHVECRFLTKNIFNQPFWSKVLSGQASQALLLGWGIEFFHYVEAANEHMAMSVAQCRNNAELQLLLAKHYAEEFDHGKIFLKGLVNSGLDGESVRQSPPLASTRALINFLRELAESDFLSYLACFGIMHSARENTTREHIEQFFRLLGDQYPSAKEMFNAFCEHASIDADLNHQKTIFEQLSDKPSQIPQFAFPQIMIAIRLCSQHFMQFFEGILDFYNTAKTVYPRVNPDVRFLL